MIKTTIARNLLAQGIPKSHTANRLGLPRCFPAPLFHQEGKILIHWHSLFKGIPRGAFPAAPRRRARGNPPASLDNR